MTIHLSLSGGLDSTVLLATAVATKEPVIAYGFNYGQRHLRELDAAELVGSWYGVENRRIRLLALSSPALVGDRPVPHGHYAADTMEATVVAGRNLLFIANIVSQAAANDEVWVGVHAGDHAIYPDCRATFIDPLRQAVRSAYGVMLMAPFMDMTKAQIAEAGHRLGAPMHLSWSCYEGREVHCGRCGTCVERAEAFHLAGVPDPTTYVDRDYWRTVVAV